MSSTDTSSTKLSDHPLLERTRHLDELGGYLRDAGDGRGSVVFIGGNAGIGKTALVREFAGQAADQGSRVLIGACDPLSTREPLAPLFDILGEAPAETRDRLLNADSRITRFRVFLEALDARPRPCLAIFEDVHWADEATLDLLRYVGRRIRETHALLVATYRNDEVGSDHPLRIVLGDVASLGTSHRMRVPALSESAVGILAEGSNFDPNELHQLTGGNPFFVTEILATDQEGIPPTVRDAVLARASRLSDRGRATLGAAAVIGSPGEIWLVTGILGAAQSAIDECIEAGMLEIDRESYRFRHEIARQAILESITPSHLAILHAQTLRKLEQSPTSRSKLARLAHHAEASGHREAVLRYAPEAARMASALRSHREAADQFERAIRFAGDLESEKRAKLLEEYAQECYVTDRMEASIRARRDALEIWRKLGDPFREGENLYRMARVLVLAGRNAEAEEASKAAIDVLERQDPSPELAAAYQVQAHLRMLNRDNAEAIARGRQAIELAERTGAREALISVYNTVGSAMLVSNDHEGRRYLERSVRMARDAGLDESVASAYGNLGSASGEIYDFEQADHYLEEGIAFCIERDLDFERNYMQAWLALSHLHQGRWSRASAIASTLLRYPGLSPISRIMAQVALGRIRARRGDPEAWPLLDEALEAARKTATLQRLGPVHSARAEAAWLEGDHDRTREEANQAFELAVRQGHQWFIGEMAYWRWKSGDLDDAPEGAAEPYALQMHGDARAAAARWSVLKCPYEAARAMAESDDSSSVRLAFEELDSLGAVPARTAVAQRLRELGVQEVPRGSRPTTLANPAQLTRRQIEVAELIARGCTNGQIAERLYISPKTVENHITAIFSKLEVDNRIEAVREISRLGIFQAK